jgi:hypothetical protein
MGAQLAKLNHAVGVLLQTAVFVCVPVLGQQSVPPSLSVADTDTRKIIQGIEAGDVNALGVAALSGNQIFVPYLKEQLRNPKAKLHNETSTLQMGLAKAGQVQQLQQISCELNFGDSSARFDAMRKVESVGGWFAISNMAEFLKKDPRYTSALGGGLAPLQDYALQFLPNLVPAPPPAPPQQILIDHTKVIAIWSDYLQSRHGSLRALPPTGEGVFTSEAVCVRVLKRDPAIHRKAGRKPKNPSDD